MKRFLIAMIVIMSMVMTSVAVSAKTTTKSSSKAKSSTTLTMKRTADGYPDITGHTYSYKESGVTFKFTFKPNNVLSIIASCQGQTATSVSGWSQSQSQVTIYNNDGSVWNFTKVGDNAKQLRGYIEGELTTFTLVK